ncbi:MAG: tetratricopeptide repeat protein [Sandaracinaceae bacterium]
MRRQRLILLAAASLCAGGIPLLAGAQNETASSELPPGIPTAPSGVCIAPAAQSNVESCPTDAPPPDSRAGVQAVSAANPESHFRETRRDRPEPTTAGPTGPSIDIDVATRQNRETIEVRELQLLQREVTVLERLVNRLRDGDPRGAEYLLSLAEAYFELQQIYKTRAGELEEPIFQARQAQNQAQVQRLQQQQREAESQLQAYRQQAIAQYARLVRDYPNYRGMDRVLFSLAFGLEEMRQFERARQVYRRLIKSFPQSQYIPHAWLSFAEFYFNEGNMDAANQFYDKVVEIPADRNPVFGYALYKKAWALYNLEDMRGALTQFVRVIEFATENPEARDASNLADQSRRELVLPFSRVGRPAQALEFFRRYAEDEAQARRLLENLAELYYDTGLWPQTIETYHRLMAVDPRGDRVCYWQSRVANAVISSEPKGEQILEVRRMVELFDTYAEQSHPQQAVTECKQATAGILVELATAWHREAIGDEQQNVPGTNDVQTISQAARLYQIILDRFPDLGDLEFPDIARRDWPTAYNISYYYAELLWRSDNWELCGPAFDRVVALDPQGPYTSDAAYAAVLCYNNLYQSQFEADDRRTREQSQAAARRTRRGQEPEEPSLAPRDLSEIENGMLNAFQRFVCFVAESDELPTIKYRRARIYYESNRFEEAALLFKDIAWNHRDSELAEYAANLYLDSMNVLGTRWMRSSCIGDIRDSIEPLAGFYCSTPTDRELHPDLCGVLDQLRCDTLRLQAEAAQRERRYKDAASTYITIAREHRECGALDEVLFNAAKNFEAARLLGRAIRTRQVLITNFPDSRLSRRSIYLVGANFHALAIYSAAAEWYERFAREYPGEDGSECTQQERDNNTCPVAHEALQNAVFFRLGLGDEEAAVSDAELFERNYRRRRPQETAQVMFSLGAIYEREENWFRVFQHYRDWLSRYGRRAQPHQVIRANVQLGVAELGLDNKDTARRYFERALAEWNRNTPERIQNAEGMSDEEKGRILALAQNAASEALFNIAEYAFDDFRAVRFPRFRGRSTMERVTRWAQEDFTQWLQEKNEALERARTAYARVNELQIPEWLIASAARIGEMYRSFMEQIRQAPIPEEIENDPELEGVYIDALEQAARPLQQTALEKFETCLSVALEVRWFNEFSQQCERELNVLDAAQYPLAAELRGEADYVERQLARPGRVDLISERDDTDLDTGDDAVTESATPSEEE